MRSRCFALATFAAFVAMAAPAAAAKEPPPWLKVEDGVTQPQFAFANAIEEVVYVESAVDSDNDGRRDRVRIRISRPGETESQGIKVPVVLEHSPYRGNTGSLANHNVDLDELPQESIGRERLARSGARAGAGRRRSRPARPARQLLRAARLRGRAR